MLKFKLVLLFVLLLTSVVTYSQKKATVIQNLGYNDLNNYNPKPFLDDVLIMLQQKLEVKKIIDHEGPHAQRVDTNWNSTIKNIIEKKKASDNEYLIALSSELKLPAVNIGKLLFKNPPRSSKLIFTFHVYNAKGIEVLGDTIINRGCISRTVDPDKGSKSFYADYQNFLDDMHCHLDIIRQRLQIKELPNKQTLFKEAR